MNHTVNNDKTAAVALDFYWQPITADTPKGVKMLLINKQYGVASIGFVTKHDYWTHWAPLPRWKKDD